jgi:hypothetical protein
VLTAPLPSRRELATLARDLRCTAALTDRTCGGGGGATRGAFSFAPTAAAAGFDYAPAAAAYAALAAPFEAMLEGASALIVVPDRALAALPFHLMLSEPAAPGTSPADAAWLIRRMPVTVVPTVAGLAGLRTLGGEGTADRPFLGMGDPLIGAQRLGPLPYDCGRPPARTAAALVSRAADGSGLSALPALPDTRCELAEAARLFGTPEAVLVQAAATETAVKGLSAAGDHATRRITITIAEPYFTIIISHYTNYYITRY